MKLQIDSRYLVLGGGHQRKKRKRKRNFVRNNIFMKKEIKFSIFINSECTSTSRKVLNTHNTCVNRGKQDSQEGIFDIKKESGEWLCIEDRRLYYLQIKSKAQVWCASGKATKSKTIPPSIRRKETLMPNTTKTTPMSSSMSETKTETEYQVSER